MIKNKTSQSGAALILVLSITAIFLASSMGLISLGIYRNRLYLQQSAKQQALHIAEAGANYYRWHLAHELDDYYDGTGADPGEPGEPYGPYEHTFYEPSGSAAGTYVLEITPPPIGSTIVKVKSTGWVNSYPNIKRTVEIRYGDPSLAHYSFLTNSDIWFGDSENVRGEMHSNGGVRMDGTNDSIVASARNTYICTFSHGCNSSNCGSPCAWISGTGCECPAVWGAGPNYDLWDYPVPIVDFNSITADIAEIKDNALYFGSSGGNNDGYHVIFQNDGTFDVYIVNSLEAAIYQYKESFTGCGQNIAEKINSETYDNNYAIPANGLIYIEDDVWVEGTVNGRATLVAARLPDNINKRKTIYINNNINYLARDGNHILGLIAQKHIKIPQHAPTDLVIDAILLAQNGRCFRNYYCCEPSCDVKNSIEVYGGIITNQIWTWSWADGTGATIDGYNTTTSIYDSNATYAPTPSFPTTGEYVFISWEEK